MVIEMFKYEMIKDKLTKSLEYIKYLCKNKPILK